MMWAITEDKMDLGIKGLGTRSMREAGVKSKDLKHAFRLLDDDRVVYAHGRASEEDFGPLDWALPRFGCTMIQFYNKKNRKWETL